MTPSAGRPARALVRPPGATYPRALTGRRPPPDVDLALAAAQHAEYVSELRRCGIDVTVLPPEDSHPDAVFVQDRILVVDGRAIVCPSAVASRRGEETGLLAAIDSSLSVERLPASASLDGGDVLVTDDALFVGLSDRSNRSAVDALAALLRPRRVEGVPLPSGLLHLLSGCTYLGGGLLLVLDSLASQPFAREFQALPVAAGEAGAANALALGDDVIVPSRYPVTAGVIAERGFRVHPVDVSEFEKRDGGVTCLSLLF